MYSQLKRTLLAACFWVMAAAVAMAQGVKITGTLVDRDTKDGVMLATVQMLKADST